MPSFDRAITNTLRVGFAVVFLSALIGLLLLMLRSLRRSFVQVYDRTFPRCFCFPVVSPPFVLSLSIIMMFVKRRTRGLLGILTTTSMDSKGIFIVQTMSFFPQCAT